MKHLITIRDSDVYENVTNKAADGFRYRAGVRAIVLDENSAVAMLHVANRGYYKLPGGGVHEGEELLQALAREAKEELGCKIEVTGELGIVDEYRQEWNLRQESFCYLAKLDGPKGQPDFTEEELRDGFKVVWVKTFQEAIMLVEASKSPGNYEWPFIKMREIALLTAAKDAQAND